jgi:outer membrane protein TolC
MTKPRFRTDSGNATLALIAMVATLAAAGAAGAADPDAPKRDPAAAPHAAAQDTTGEQTWLDVVSVLQLAARQSRTAIVVASEEAAAAADVRKAQAGWWPSVDFKAQYNYRDNPVLVGTEDFNFPSQQKRNVEYQISAREVLWNGGRRSLAVDAARQREEAVRAAGRADLQHSQLAALDAYFSVLALGGNAHVLDQREGALRAHLEVVTDLYDQGLTARNDLLETQVRLRQVEDARAALEHRRQVALQDLNRQLGRDPGALAALPDSLSAPPPLPGDRDSLLTAASERNAALRAAALKVAADETAARLARRAWWPTLFVGAYHSYTENDFLIYPYLNAVLAGVTWDVFDGGSRSADTQRAEAAVAAAARDHVEAQRSVIVAVDAAWRRWDQARREERTARANVAAAAENLRIVADQYQAGVARSSDVLDAEALLAESLFDVVTRHYAIYEAQASLLVSAGWDLVDFYAGGATATEGR